MLLEASKLVCSQVLTQSPPWDLTLFSPKILGWPNVQQLWETCHSKVVGLLHMWDIGWGKGGMWKRQILLWGLQQADIFFSVSLFLCRCKFHQGGRSGGSRQESLHKKVLQMAFLLKKPFMLYTSFKRPMWSLSKWYKRKTPVFWLFSSSPFIYRKSFCCKH